MSYADALVAELTQESQTTLRFLERVPADRLDWKPHEKSMTAGQLAMHIATIPGQIASMAAQNPCPMPDFSEGFAQPVNAKEVIAKHGESVAAATATVSGLSDADMGGTWTCVMGDKEVMSMPRGGFLRAIMLNHLYHHRGQLGVYLRMMGVDVPYAYGPSADEMPPEFAAMMEAAG